MNVCIEFNRQTNSDFINPKMVKYIMGGGEAFTRYNGLNKPN